MNEEERAQIQWLKTQQERLQQELNVLSRHLQALERRATTGETSQSLEAGAQSALVQHQVSVVSGSSVPPVIESIPELKTRIADLRVSITGAATPGTGALGSDNHKRVPASSDALLMEPAPAAVSAGAPAKSLELRLGTYWFVRIGVVMVLTAAVFFGKLAYQNLGPGGKVSLLYLGSALLLGAGAWWQRKAASASMRNYAQVLFAGGQAGVYFTTYAAHHIEQLRIISSPLVDGILLLLWAAFMAWSADRLRSEILALFGIGLAYYTCIVTRVGSFTLYSNLILAVGAVFFLVRNRWATLSFAGLGASYLAYAFWRFFNGTQWQWASPGEGLWTGASFLFSYWAVFTAGVFLSRDRTFAGRNRVAFLTLNNGAMFTMFVLTMLQVQHGGFWKFCLIYGSVLLGLAALARATLKEQPLATNAYLTQGLLIVTIGFISKFSGLQLSLVLAAESVILQLLGRQRKSMVLLGGSWIAAGLATGWAMDGITPVRDTGLYLALGIGVLMLANATIANRFLKPLDSAMLRPAPTWFSALALFVLLLATWHYTDRQQFPLVLASAAVIFTASIYLVGIPELVLVAQLYLGLANLAWLTDASTQALPPWWSAAGLVLLTCFVAHWWQRQKTIHAWPDVGTACQLIYALAVVGIICFWCGPQLEHRQWLALAAGLAIVLTVYSVITRWWYLGIAAQILLIVSCTLFVRQIIQNEPGWSWALAPIFALNLLASGTCEWFRRHPAVTGVLREVLLRVALAYRWIALATIIVWVCEYIPERERIWAFSLMGVAIFAWAGCVASIEAVLYSCVLTIAALVLFWIPSSADLRIYWPNLLAFLTLGVEQQVARRLPERYRIPAWAHTAAILACGVTLWLYVSRWVRLHESGFYLTASWSGLALALFTAGIAFRERVYRWLGLAILACALARVVVFDVWKLETLYRIISFMALGIVLLVLGFIYNKYQEKLKEWL